jgi:hypothetical protein
VRHDGSVPSLEPAVAVIDTGVTGASGGVNVTGNGGRLDTADYCGHGTAVAGTVCEVAGGVRIVPVKAIGDDGVLATPRHLDAAFDWVLDHHERLGIAVVCAAIGDATHATSDLLYRDGAVCRIIAALRAVRVPTVAAAGNGQSEHEYYGGPYGCSWPAVLRETVSVGAAQQDPDGALTPHPRSQRLHASLGTGCATTLFAVPGAPGGTSGAAAVVTGLLAAARRERPADNVDELLAALLRGAGAVRDAAGHAWPVVVGATMR